MDVEMAGSFLIGGMIVLTILGVNAQVLETGSVNALHTYAQENAASVVSILEYDFRKIGYGVSDTSQAILSLSDTTITYLSDSDRNGTVDTVAYRLSSTSGPAATDNPNDRYLYRSIDGTEEDIALGLTEWELTFYDADGISTTDAEAVRSIGVSFEVETTFPFDETYGRAAWQGRITPKNLGD